MCIGDLRLYGNVGVVGYSVTLFHDFLVIHVFAHALHILCAARARVVVIIIIIVVGGIAILGDARLSALLANWPWMMPLSNGLLRPSAAIKPRNAP